MGSFGFTPGYKLETPRRPVTIVEVNVEKNLAVARDSQYGRIIIDLSITNGPVVVYPSQGEGWYVTKIFEKWVLDRRTPFQNAALVETASPGDWVLHNPNGAILISDQSGVLVSGNLSTSHTAVSFQNGWENFGGSFQTVAYKRKADGAVRIRGSAKNALLTSSLTIFQLPLDLCPSKVETFLGVAGEGLCKLEVGLDGQVKIVGYLVSGDASYVSVAIEFDTLA